jgi:hypothetical protein
MPFHSHCNGTYQHRPEEPLFIAHRRYQVAAEFVNAQLDGGFTVVGRGGMNNYPAYHASISQDEQVLLNLGFRETGFKHCDTVMRKTGVQ